MLAPISKTAFSLLASSTPLKRAASRYGMRNPGSFARRFVAGETLDDAIAAARPLESRGYQITLDLLGESVRTVEAAAEATTTYVGIIRAIEQAGIGRNISVKLTQLGLDIDHATTVDNLRRILDPADRAGFFVRIDMEGSAYTGATLDVFETAWTIGYRNVGVVLQSCLKRSDADARRVNALGARIRLVKGAYREPRAIAFQKKADVDTAFVSLMKLLLTEGTFPAIATHDPAMIDATRTFARERSLGADKFEFQMLYGVRRDLQDMVLSGGYGVRVYIPFGREWFPYFMRRLGERPANVGFVVRSLLAERKVAM
jgi:proline dehydrogenase